ncbi:phage virion morphogenesis protein [Vibrio ruber]|uniref:phage virion morphogenesis protein n=1 Tax=Vibrio ruber TaxID=184755 RepID=UPI002892A1D5|nr:phage virion morphogenesis protein [Vibrio ruber]WNJ96542.1 phage virion morphogenesis protein [Vibrio ruber]
MSISVTIYNGDTELQQMRQFLERLSDTGNRDKLMHLIGAEAESQTHRRIRNEKTAPDGSPWPEWSPQYSGTRHGNQSLLMGDGALDDSIQYYVKGNQVSIGSSLAYAAVQNDGFDGMVSVPAHTRLIHQAFGRELAFPVYQSVSAHSRHLEVPQREYLGLSSENETDLLTLIGDFYGDMLK